MSQITQLEFFNVLHCANCGVGFAISTEYEDKRRADRRTFYCPNGHSQWFPGKTDKKVIEELRAQVASREDLLQSTRLERDKHYRLRRAAEGKARAIRKRVAAGVCPRCTRTFQNLARHMHTKHPGFPHE